MGYGLFENLCNFHTYKFISHFARRRECGWSQIRNQLPAGDEDQPRPHPRLPPQQRGQPADTAQV